MRKVEADCRATLGEVGNAEHMLRVLGKAGAARWRGVRPVSYTHLDVYKRQLHRS